MKSILTTKEQSLLSLAEYLIKEDKRIEEVSDYLSITPRRIEQLVQEFNELAVPIQIYYRDKLYLHLHLPDAFSTRSIYSTFLSNSLHFSILEKIFFEEFHSYLSLSETLYVSESTIKRAVKKLNEVLAPYHIEISKRPLSIIGNERNIRAFFFSFFMEKYGVAVPTFSSAILSSIEKTWEKALIYFNFTASYSDRIRFLTWGCVLLHRETTNHPFFDATNNEAVEVLTTFALHTHLEDDFNSFELSQQSFYTLMEQLFSPQLISNIMGEQTKPAKPDLSKKNIQLLHNRIEKLIDTISVSLEIPIDQDTRTRMAKELLNCLTIYQAHPFRGFLLQDPHAQFLHNNNAIIKAFFSYVAGLIQELVGKQTDAVLYYLFYTICTHWDNLLSDMYKQLPTLQIGILVDADREHAHYLKNRLSYYFPIVAEFTVTQTFSLDTDDLLHSDHFDFLVTTLLLPENSTYENILSINMALTNNDLKNILNKISTVIEKYVNQEIVRLAHEGSLISKNYNK